jgi:hypothetical protein
LPSAPAIALGVVNAQPDAVRIAEIELGEIAMQMLLAAVLVGSDHAALEKREIAFCAVHTRIAARPFFFTMVDALVAGELRPMRR